MVTATESRPGRGEARDELLASALRLFAEQGYRETSTRQIASDARVSHALLRYHFSSKAGLRDAVDEDVLSSFGRAVTAVRKEQSGSGGLAEVGRAAALVFGADQNRRRYIRRMLVDGDERAATLFQRLVSGAEREVERLLPKHHSLTVAEHRWAAYQVLFLVLGPLLLEPTLEVVLGGDPFAAATLAERSAANQSLLQRGLFTPK